jgi:hypothetical protein
MRQSQAVGGKFGIALAIGAVREAHSDAAIIPGRAESGFRLPVLR